jgi:hypothetical protein
MSLLELCLDFGSPTVIVSTRLLRNLLDFKRLPFYRFDVWSASLDQIQRPKGSLTFVLPFVSQRVAMTSAQRSHEFEARLRITVEMMLQRMLLAKVGACITQCLQDGKIRL